MKPKDKAKLFVCPKCGHEWWFQPQAGVQPTEGNRPCPNLVKATGQPCGAQMERRERVWADLTADEHRQLMRFARRQQPFQKLSEALREAVRNLPEPQRHGDTEKNHEQSAGK